MNGVKGITGYCRLDARKRIIMSVLAGGLAAALCGSMAGVAAANPDDRLDSEENSRMITVTGCDSEQVTLAQRDYDIFVLHNQRRAQIGVKELCLDKNLTLAAQGHADDMATRNFYSHVTPEGKTVNDRIAATDYCWDGGGENAGMVLGKYNPRYFHDGWMNSTGHRENIENDYFGRVGMGSAARFQENESSRAAFGDTYYGVVNFGAECSDSDWDGDEPLNPAPPVKPNAKPSVGNLSVIGANRKAARPMLATTVRDSDSSITKSRIVVKLDGKRVRFSYNAATDKLTAKSGRKLRKGSHVYSVQVNDGEGAAATKTKRFKTR